MSLKKIFGVFGIIIVAGALYYAWYVHVNYRFETISENKVYKSALIKPDRLEDFLIENNIKTVIDLLDPGVQDALNPATQKEIDAEDRAVKMINEKHALNIQHVSIPSGQVPTKKTLTRFFEVLDDPNNYPVLIHCYHGTGVHRFIAKFIESSTKTGQMQMRVHKHVLWLKDSVIEAVLPTEKKKVIF